MKDQVPGELEKRILRENGLNPDSFSVIHKETDVIYLRCYKTRDVIAIYKGDRPWK